MAGHYDRVEPFVQAMLSGIRARSHGVFTKAVPRDFTDKDVDFAARRLQEAGFVVLCGITKYPRKYSVPFLAMRVCTADGYVQYRVTEGTVQGWVACGIALILSVLLGAFVHEHTTLWIPALFLGITGWGTAAAYIISKQKALKNIELPSEPLHEWLPYGFW